MLKRQRPSSPLPNSTDFTVDAKEAPEDLYEPDHKRRRYFTPSEADKSLWRSTADSELDTRSDDSYGWRGEGIESRYEGVNDWQRHAGEYKTANVLLHDLHAQQRHRTLFASPPPTYAPYAAEAAPPSSHNETKEPSHGNDAMGRRDSCTNGSGPSMSPEEQLVFQRYEDTNKFLGSLVLSRRRHLDSSPP